MAYFINEQCIGCTACVAVCPVNAIHGLRKQPHSINAKRCIECGACGRVCPKGAIQDYLGKTVANIPRAQWEKPFIDSSVCSACAICLDICRFRCIELSKPQYRRDLEVYAYLKEPKKCVACSMCANACPLEAIRMEVVKTEGENAI